MAVIEIMASKSTPKLPLFKTLIISISIEKAIIIPEMIIKKLAMLDNLKPKFKIKATLPIPKTIQNLCKFDNFIPLFLETILE